MQEIKNTLLTECESALNKRLAIVVNVINDINESLQTETKSTAGDKHETGRAMLHLDREKAGKQLAAIKEQLELLRRVKIDTVYTQVALGSLVLTSKNNYFIAISLGAVKLEETYYIIAANTPIGKLLLGKKVGEQFTFNGNTEIIEAIN